MVTNPYPGIFIVFEGLDRSGKATQLNLTRNWLENNEGDYFVGFYSEPNYQSSLVGKRIRQILKHEIESPEPFALQRLYVLDRAQNNICLLIPELKKGHIMLLERYAYSTLAYGMLNFFAEEFLSLHRDILGPNMIWPDLALFFDLSAETALARNRRAQNTPQFFEKKKLLTKARENYLKLSKRTDLGKIIVIDAERTPEEIFEDVKKEITTILGLKNKSA